MKSIKLVHNYCPICGNKNDYHIVYHKNFKSSDINQTIFSARRLPDRIHYQIVKCQECGLVRSNPTAQSSILNNLYRVSKFNYSEEIDNLINTYTNHLLSTLRKISNKDNILEIGCGSGFILSYVNVYGVEPSIDAFNKANKIIKKNISNEMFGSKTFADKKFKLICIFQTLDHISDPNTFIKNCYQLLDKGGYLVAFNHNIDSFSSKLLGEKSPIIDIEHTCLYSPQTITKLFIKHKFNVMNVYSPKNVISLRHLIWLAPFPNKIKEALIKINSNLLNHKISVKLGNLCIIVQK